MQPNQQRLHLRPMMVGIHHQQQYLNPLITMTAGVNQKQMQLIIPMIMLGLQSHQRDQMIIIGILHLNLLPPRMTIGVHQQHLVLVMHGATRQQLQLHKNQLKQPLGVTISKPLLLLLLPLLLQLLKKVAGMINPSNQMMVNGVP